ncbi:hypothetical protein FA13DRAFT_495770 [Coprinellus micaceus]|uniref:Uncharacterized protein n=1 Tax=Coprinellus micaceus TaxID=71717 RepID=A0A4Y7TB10_COPMI|nr:hypothetical protein FA13DRAFT_495770 [Coprinellus micaceus]
MTNALDARNPCSPCPAILTSPRPPHTKPPSSTLTSRLSSQALEIRHGGPDPWTLRGVRVDWCPGCKDKRGRKQRRTRARVEVQVPSTRPPDRLVWDRMCRRRPRFHHLRRFPLALPPPSTTPPDPPQSVPLPHIEHARTDRTARSRPRQNPARRDELNTPCLTSSSSRRQCKTSGEDERDGAGQVEDEGTDMARERVVKGMNDSGRLSSPSIHHLPSILPSFHLYHTSLHHTHALPPTNASTRPSPRPLSPLSPLLNLFRPTDRALQLDQTPSPRLTLSKDPNCDADVGFCLAPRTQRRCGLEAWWDVVSPLPMRRATSREVGCRRTDGRTRVWVSCGRTGGGESQREGGMGQYRIG